MGLHVKGCVVVFPTCTPRRQFIIPSNPEISPSLHLRRWCLKGDGRQRYFSEAFKWREMKRKPMTNQRVRVYFVPLYLNVSRELQGAKLSTKHDVSLLLISPSLNSPRPPLVAKYLSVPTAASAPTLPQRG